MRSYNNKKRNTSIGIVRLSRKYTLVHLATNSEKLNELHYKCLSNYNNFMRTPNIYYIAYG